MSVRVEPCRDHEQLAAAINAISHYFGQHNTAEDAERFANWIEVDRMHAAWEGGRVVGGAGAFTFDLSVPGGHTVPSAGVTVVGVQPTHRRRGILTEMMRAQLADVRERGEPVAWLWASEATIYTRFGYGLASLTGEIELPRERTAYARPFGPRGIIRSLDVDEAAELFPPIHEAVLRERPGVYRRSRPWWETRRLADDPGRRQAGQGPLHRVLLELDGEPAAYALYRIAASFEGFVSTGAVTVVEALGATSEALAAMWQWLLEMDWMATIKASLLPLDHPLFLLLAEPRRLRLRVVDGVWVRLVDVGGALSARSVATDEPLVLDVRDSFLPQN